MKRQTDTITSVALVAIAELFSFSGRSTLDRITTTVGLLAVFQPRLTPLVLLCIMLVEWLCIRLF